MDNQACLELVHLFEDDLEVARSETVESVLEIDINEFIPPKKLVREHSYTKSSDLGLIPGAKIFLIGLISYMNE
jgi:hypothetical protein